MTKTQTLHFRRDGAGRQVSTDGRYAVEADGYERSHSVGSDYYYEGFNGGEWAAIVDGENFDWFPTMREAKAFCQRHAATRPRDDLRFESAGCLRNGKTIHA